MIIDESLRNKIRKDFNDFMFNNFEKVIDELNFIDGTANYYSKPKGVNIQIKFQNSWELFVWHDGTFDMINDSGRYNEMAFSLTYEDLLKFMEKQGIRKHRQCEYKDAELYLVDFGEQYAKR